MLAGRASRCLRRGRAVQRKQVFLLSARRLSTSASPPTHGGTSLLPPLLGLSTELDRIAPRIELNSQDLTILETPAEFYNTLRNRISTAKRRIYLSTLYIGTSERDLIQTIRNALEKNENLQVSILTDALRGTRESPNTSCASLLAPLARDFPGRVEIRMYHTPNLTGIRKAIVPRRINEGWGLQHMKLYGVDDELILSGANLSNDYFTNRQDRYHMFKSKEVADYFAGVHDTACSVSNLLEYSNEPGGHRLVWPASNKAPDPLSSPSSYRAASEALIRPLISPRPARVTPSASSTILYPLIVCPPAVNNELPAINTLLSTSRPMRSYTFTAGYFNPHPFVTRALLALSSHPTLIPGIVLTASPFANGFYGSKGISGMLPAAYTHLSTVFLRAVNQYKAKIQLREWQCGVVGQQGAWTYHAKGLWATLPTSNTMTNTEDEEGPNVTIIGSSNYTTRSYTLDLEVGAIMLTSDPALRRRLGSEVRWLAEHTREVKQEELESEQRRANWRVRLAMWIVEKVGGAL